MAKPTDAQFIELLYKKFLGYPDGKPGNNYNSEVPVFARNKIIPTKQIYLDNIPAVAPNYSGLGWTSAAVSPHPFAGDVSKIWGGAALSSYGRVYSNPDVKIKFYEDIPLTIAVIASTAISYHCVRTNNSDKPTTDGTNSDGSAINYLSNQVPLNFDPIFTIFNFDNSKLKNRI